MADRDRVVVLEQPRGRRAVVRAADSPTRARMSWGREVQIAVVDCFALRVSVANCDDLRDLYRWQRFRALARFRRDGPHARVGDVSRIMLDTADRGYEVFDRATLQSMVFVPRRAELYLYATGEDGRHPPDPLMHRYSDLARGADAEAAPNGLLPLWLSVILAAGVVLWVFLSDRRRGG
jgi:hypothetical protein